MATTRQRAGTAAALLLAATWTLAGCGSEPAAEPTPSQEAPTEEPAESPEPEPSPSAEAPDDDALPAGFPDPASLVGQEAYDEQTADGSWRTVVGDTPLDLALAFGSCFDGGSGDVCGYSISGSMPPAPDGTLQPAEVGLLLLLRSTGALADGTPTWEVLDARAVRTPGGEPAYLELCDGADGVAIYADPDADPAAATVPVAAAWGPNPGVTAIVEVDPASLTCAYIGD